MSYIKYKSRHFGGQISAYHFNKINKGQNNQERIQFTLDDAEEFVKYMKIDMNSELFTLTDIMNGMNVELEHGTQNPQTNVTDNDLMKTGKIALAHLHELPDYYQRLKKMENEEEQQGGQKSKYIIRRFRY